MDPRLVTGLLAVAAAGCYAGGAFVPNPQAQVALFALGSFLLGVIGVSKPADMQHVRRSKAFMRDAPKVRAPKP